MLQKIQTVVLTCVGPVGTCNGRGQGVRPRRSASKTPLPFGPRGGWISGAVWGHCKLCFPLLHPFNDCPILSRPLRGRCKGTLYLGLGSKRGPEAKRGTQISKNVCLWAVTTDAHILYKIRPVWHPTIHRN